MSAPSYFAITIALKDGVSNEQFESFVGSLKVHVGLDSYLVSRELHRSGLQHLHACVAVKPGTPVPVGSALISIRDAFGDIGSPALCIKECSDYVGWLGYCIKSGDIVATTFDERYLDSVRLRWRELNAPSRKAIDPDLKLDAYADVLCPLMEKSGPVTSENFARLYIQAFCQVLRSRTIKNAHFASKNKPFIQSLKIEIKIRFGLSIDSEVAQILDTLELNSSMDIDNSV